MTSDIFLTCSPDFSDICALEVKELIKKEADVAKGVCVVKQSTVQQAAKLSFYAQSPKHVSVLLGRIPFSTTLSDEEVKTLCVDQSWINQSVWNLFASKQQSFAVRALKLAITEASTLTFEKYIGEALHDFSVEHEISCAVDLKRPDMTIHVAVTDGELFIGIDLIGFDLSKRPYRLFSFPSSINSSFAYYLLRLCGYNKKGILLDLFSGSGTIPIEAALYKENLSPYRLDRKFSAFHLEETKDIFGRMLLEAQEKQTTSKGTIYGYDKQLKIISGAQKNAKIAGIKDAITFSKIELDWVDAKFEEGGVHFIITDPPKINKRAKNEKDIMKLYDELFYQAKYLLHKKGKLGILVVKEDILIDSYKKHNFELESRHSIHNGEQEYLFFIFKKSN